MSQHDHRGARRSQEKHLGGASRRKEPLLHRSPQGTLGWGSAQHCKGKRRALALANRRAGPTPGKASLIFQQKAPNCFRK